MSAFDPNHFFSMMQQARIEAKQSIPLTARVLQKMKPSGLSFAVLASRRIASAQNFLSTTLHISLLDVPQQKIADLTNQALTKYRNSFVLDVSRKARERFSEIDQSVLNEMKQKNFIPSYMTINVQESTDEKIHIGPHMINKWVSKDYQINMVSNALGDISAHSQMVHQKQSILRWFTLLHEASHAVFSEIPNRFTPSANIPQSIQRYINDIVVHPLFGDRRHQQKNPINTPELMMSEGFADCYGSMMLLSLTNDSEEANDVVKEFYHQRKSARQFLENQVVPQMDEHFTDFAMEEMLNNKSQWINADPQEKKRLALVYASNGLVKLSQPGRYNDHGHDVGFDVNFVVGGFYNGIPPVQMLYTRLVEEYGLNEGEKLFNSRMEGHLLETVFQKMTKILNEHISDYVFHSSLQTLTQSETFWPSVTSSEKWLAFNQELIETMGSIHKNWHDKDYPKWMFEKFQSDISVQPLSPATILRNRENVPREHSVGRLATL